MFVLFEATIGCCICTVTLSVWVISNLIFALVTRPIQCDFFPLKIFPTISKNKQNFFFRFLFLYFSHFKKKKFFFTFSLFINVLSQQNLLFFLTFFSIMDPYSNPGISRYLNSSISSSESKSPSRSGSQQSITSRNGTKNPQSHDEDSTITSHQNNDDESFPESSGIATSTSTSISINSLNPTSMAQSSQTPHRPKITIPTFRNKSSENATPITPLRQPTQRQQQQSKEVEVGSGVENSKIKDASNSFEPTSAAMLSPSTANSLLSCDDFFPTPSSFSVTVEDNNRGNQSLTNNQDSSSSIQSTLTGKDSQSLEYDKKLDMLFDQEFGSSSRPSSSSADLTGSPNKQKTQLVPATSRPNSSRKKVLRSQDKHSHNSSSKSDLEVFQNDDSLCPPTSTVPLEKGNSPNSGSLQQAKPDKNLETQNSIGIKKEIMPSSLSASLTRPVVSNIAIQLQKSGIIRII